MTIILLLSQVFLGLCFRRCAIKPVFILWSGEYKAFGSHGEIKIFISQE